MGEGGPQSPRSRHSPPHLALDWVFLQNRKTRIGMHRADLEGDPKHTDRSTWEWGRERKRRKPTEQVSALGTQDSTPLGHVGWECKADIRWVRLSRGRCSWGTSAPRPFRRWLRAPPSPACPSGRYMGSGPPYAGWFEAVGLVCTGMVGTNSNVHPNSMIQTQWAMTSKGRWISTAELRTLRAKPGNFNLILSYSWSHMEGERGEGGEWKPRTHSTYYEQRVSNTLNQLSLQQLCKKNDLFSPGKKKQHWGSVGDNFPPKFTAPHYWAWIWNPDEWSSCTFCHMGPQVKETESWGGLGGSQHLADLAPAFPSQCECQLPK